ncbi:hypothetical protein [Paracoccus sp. S3-43]|uniref:hypothetical protein n=1 Tax=Paracoccus sp. S3-43 TaxID=3030011 RepID=UPI0023AF1028|nr:hypothetical protein [Paracoccus sp. S3-43]WEF24522.1 hypothetical protein PXD02_00700 [Paracoccus sp. S3-43]
MSRLGSVDSVCSECERPDPAFITMQMVPVERQPAVQPVVVAHHAFGHPRDDLVVAMLVHGDDAAEIKDRTHGHCKRVGRGPGIWGPPSPASGPRRQSPPIKPDQRLTTLQKHGSLPRQQDINHRRTAMAPDRRCCAFPETDGRAAESVSGSSEPPHSSVRRFLLPAICANDVVDEVLATGAPLDTEFLAANSPADPSRMPMPLEFSAAGFRFGHSMVRGGYDHNHFFGTAAAGSAQILLCQLHAAVRIHRQRQDALGRRDRHASGPAAGRHDQPARRPSGEAPGDAQPAARIPG